MIRVMHHESESRIDNYRILAIMAVVVLHATVVLLFQFPGGSSLPEYEANDALRAEIRWIPPRERLSDFGYWTMPPPDPCHGWCTKATQPPYPRAALRSRMEGTVTLLILVDTDGTPLEVSIDTSSGSPALDNAALRHVKQTWRFRPDIREGKPAQAIRWIPIEFSLPEESGQVMLRRRNLPL